MWGQASRILSRNSTVAEKTLKLLACVETSSCTPLYIPKRRISNQKRETKAQKVISKKHTSQGRRRIEIYPPPFLIPSQSVVLPGPERIRASAVTDNPEKCVEYPDEDTKTVCDVPLAGYKKTKTGLCIGSRTPSKSPEYDWITYKEVFERIRYVGSGLINLGLEPSSQSFVGICTKTRPEFILTTLGACRYSMVLVPLYECLNGDMITYIVQQVGLEVLICENFKIASLVIQHRERYPHLKHIVLIDDTESINELRHTEINVISFKELEELGKAKEHEQKKPKPEDLFCLCYTSGTTGQPKGVMITHRNVMSTLASMDVAFGEAISESGILFAYLPCAHIYEILNETYCLLKGGQLGYYSGNTDNLLEDIKYLKPTVLPLVPKLMNRIYSAVKQKVGPNPLKRYLLKLALNYKEKYLKKGIMSKDTIWDYLLFQNVQKLLGGNVEMLFCASAPVSKEVMKFFRCASGCLVFEAYGLSEVGAAAITLMSEHDSGFIGPPLSSNHIKLVSVPEFSYDAKDDVGEICIRGPNVFSGYYKNPEETAKALDEDGWHYTGDIGKWLPNGTISIMDRKKHIFKLNQGEYIVPEKSENIYVQSHLLSQAFVDGQMEQDFPVAIVVPDEPAFMKWAKEKGFQDTYEELCKNYNVKIALLYQMIKTGKRKNLGSLQQVGNIHITPEPFTPENGLLTPTMKLKRPEARNKYEKIVQQLYDEGNLRKKHKL